MRWSTPLIRNRSGQNTPSWLPASYGSFAVPEPVSLLTGSFPDAGLLKPMTLLMVFIAAAVHDDGDSNRTMNNTAGVKLYAWERRSPVGAGLVIG